MLFDAAACTRLLPEHRHGAGGHNFEHAPAKTRQVSVRLLTNALHAHLLDHDSSIVVYWYSFSNPCTFVRSLIWPTNLETVHHFGDAAACFGLPSRLYNVLLTELCHTLRLLCLTLSFLLMRATFDAAACTP